MGRSISQAGTTVNIERFCLRVDEFLTAPQRPFPIEERQNTGVNPPDVYAAKGLMCRHSFAVAAQPSQEWVGES